MQVFAIYCFKNPFLSKVCAVCRTDAAIVQCIKKVHFVFDLEISGGRIFANFLEVYWESIMVARRRNVLIEVLVWKSKRQKAFKVSDLSELEEQINGFLTALSKKMDTN